MQNQSSLLHVQNELELVVYPGIVKNVDKMLSTLGGINRISQVLGGDEKRFELKYHPNNPLNKSIAGDSRQDVGVLLSVKIKRKRPTNSCKVTVVGFCKRVHIFETLCDFQYLPIAKNYPSNNWNYLLDKVAPSKVTDLNYFTLKNMPLLCIPYVFGKPDSLQLSIHRNDPAEEEPSDVLGVTQKPNYDSRDIVPFSLSETFPTHPDPQTVKRMRVKYVSDEQLERVRKLFDECPIWTRLALLYESGVSDDKLKCIIPSLAYYFSNGPWRSLYVRYGYDPRKDFNSRLYQTFDFRFRYKSGVAAYVNVKRLAAKQKQKNSEELNNIIQDIKYPYFEEGKLPRSRQSIYRYCDIKLQKVQDMMNKIPTPLAGAACNEKSGWLPSCFDAEVRQIIDNVVTAVVRDIREENEIPTYMDAEEGENASDESDSESRSDDSEGLDETLEEMMKDASVD